MPEDVSIDAVIAVYGERPYAEMQGDISTLAWQQPDFVDLEILNQYGSRVYRWFPSYRVDLCG